MTDYFKVYLRRADGGFTKQKAKKKETVKTILKHAEELNYKEYQVIRHIKGNADVIVAQGYFTEEATVVMVDNIDTDYKIVCGSIMVDNRGRLIKDEKDKNEER